MVNAAYRAYLKPVLSRDPDNAGSDSMLTMDATEDLHDWYVGGATEMLSNPFVSPVLGDLSGLPPLLFQVSSAEILLDDSLIAAERARAAGVECEVEVFDGVPHVWHAIPHLPESKRALAGIGEFVRNAMAGARARQREEQVCTTPR
jgi:monoterpene epsilon-lactone hydrolase